MPGNITFADPCSVMPGNITFADPCSVMPRNIPSKKPGVDITFKQEAWYLDRYR